jgi:glycosyltransferase involved in cell wall biosynthesis
MKPSGGSPSVSVFMPVRNAERYLGESIRSILEQTFTDFEFVIVNDGSTDGSERLLKEWAGRDRRIRLVGDGLPRGVAAASNLAVRETRAPFCARMDADDISHPDRLRRQLAVLSADPAVCLVGTLFDGIDADGRRVRPRDRWRLLRPSHLPPFAQASILFRRAAFEHVGGYCEEFALASDADMVVRVSRFGRVLVLPEALFSVRFHARSLTATASPEEMVESVQLLARRLGRSDGPVAARTMRIKTLRDLVARRVWAGERPDNGRRDPGRFPWNGPALKLRALEAWARRSPSSARLFLRTVVSLRDRLAGLLLKDGRPVEWRSE